MKVLGLTLWTAVLLFNCATSQTILPETGCISLQDTSNITYMCSNDSFPVLWQVGSTQIRDTLVDMFKENGVLVTSSPFINGSLTNITFTQQGIEHLFSSVGERGFPVNCLVERDLVELDPIQKRTVFIYSTPPPPPVDLTITPTDRPLQYLLEWSRPQPPQDCMPINYQVTVTNLVTNQIVNDMIVPGGTQRELMLVVSDTDSEQCQLYEFSVTSFNDIGESEAAVITETLPISPNVTAVSSSLTAVPVLTDGVQIQVTFQPASSCDETRYPVVKYTISISGLDGSIDIPHTGQDIVGSLTSDDFPGLQEDTYRVLVMACADFACHTSDPVTVVTNHVQHATLTFLNTTVSLVCVFADTSSAIGCRFQLELSNDNIETVDLVRTMDGGVASQGCATTQNMREAYMNFRVAAIISDDSVGRYITSPEVSTSTPVWSPCTDKPTKASQEAVTVNTICGVLLPGLVALVVGVM